MLLLQDGIEQGKGEETSQHQGGGDVGFEARGGTDSKGKSLKDNVSLHTRLCNTNP